ncbi:MAG: ABC transporter substrate-binding protein [SAR202 cluster bacterium]|nr:ABC transporter substrate-binding protein [SAR202 cluster bacterium]
MGSYKSWLRRWQVPLALLSLVTATLLILACGDDETTGATATATRPATSPTGTPGAGATPTPTATSAAKAPVTTRLKIGSEPPSTWATVNWPASNLDVSWQQMYEHLVGTDRKTSELVPELATGWSVATNGKDWNFKLRRDTPFYGRDGKPSKYTFTAKDVVHSMEMAGGYKTQTARSPGFWRTWAGPQGSQEIVNDYEIVFHLPGVNLDLPRQVSDELEAPISSLEHWNAVGGEEGYKADPIGNGPFALMEMKVNQYYLYKRIENHWRRTSEFAELQFIAVPESAVRLGMLINGEADIASVPRLLHKQVTDAGKKTYRASVPGGHHHVRIPWYKPQNYVDPATGKPAYEGAPAGPTKGYDANDPLRNVKVREAINVAINRDEINKVFFQGQFAPNVMDWFPPWAAFFKDEWAPFPGPTGKTGREGGWPFPFDIGLAKKLLAEAGYQGGGFELTMYTPNNHSLVPEMPEIAEAIGKYWRDVGISTKFVAMTNSEMFTVVNNRTEAKTLFMAVNPGAFHPCAIGPFTVYKSGRAQWDYDEFDKFIDDCATLATEEQRTRRTLELGDWSKRTILTIPLFWVFQQGGITPTWWRRNTRCTCCTIRQSVTTSLLSQPISSRARPSSVEGMLDGCYDGRAIHPQGG